MGALEVGIIVTGAVSLFCSSLVILTYFTFREMRQKRFMKFIFYISLSDLFLNVATVFGFPSNTNLCFAQGIIFNIFSMASWFWTTALSFAMYCVVSNRVTISDLHVHLFCWIVPTFTTLVQLVGGTYTTTTPRDTWCTYRSFSSTSTAVSLFFNFGLYWCWFFASVLIMVACGISVHYQLYFNRSAEFSDLIRKMYNKVVWYPVFMSLCWVIDLKNNEFGRGDPNIEAFFGMFAGSCNGIITAIIFFLNSEEARSRWYNLMFPNVNRESLLPINLPQDFEDDDVYAEDISRSSCSTRMGTFTAARSTAGSVTVSSRSTTSLSTTSTSTSNNVVIRNSNMSTMNNGIRSSTIIRTQQPTDMNTTVNTSHRHPPTILEGCGIDDIHEV